MKKIFMYITILLIVMWIPVKRIDISDLEPIQAIWINKENGKYIVTTDTEDYGVGETVQDAVQAMKEKCEKIIYLDTAKFLLVSDNCRDAIGEISEFLKENVSICVWNGEGELVNAAQYMHAHDVGIKVKDYFIGLNLPTIPSLRGGS